MSSILGSGKLDRYKPGQKDRKSLVAGAILIATGLIIGAALGRSAVIPYIMPNDAMDPVIPQGTRIFALKFIEPKRGDLVLAEAPGQDGRYVLRRVAAVHNDAVTSEGNSLLVNGQVTTTFVAKSGYNPFAGLEGIVLGKKQYYLVTVNGRYSFDSRAWGAVDATRIAGVLIYPR